MHGQLKLMCLLILRSILLPPAAAEPIPVEVFAVEDLFTNPKLSPDGQFVATIVGNRREGLGFIDVRNAKLSNAAKIGPDETVFDFAWVSAKRVVLFAELPGSERVIRGQLGDMYTAERDRSTATISYVSTGRNLRPQAALISTLERRDDAVVLISVQPKRSPIRQLPYYTPISGDTAYLLEFDARGVTRHFEDIPLTGARLVADHAQQVRFGIGYDRNGALVALHRATPKDAWEIFKLPGFRDNSIEVQRFTADNRAVTFIGVREGEALNGLFSLDLTTKAVTKLYQHSKNDIVETLTDLQTDAVAGVLVHGARPEYHWLDPSQATPQLYEMLRRSFGGQTVRITSRSEDGRKALLLVDSDTNPGDYYILDVPGRQASFLMAVRKSVDPAQMRPKQEVQIKTRDGVVLDGYLTRPAASKEPLPMVVLPHDGLPGARDAWQFDTQVQLLASRGYAVLQVNYRGSGGYGADFEAAGHRQWGARMQDDITDATRWAIEQGIAAAGRICIYGVGYGGYAALMGTIREPTLYRCAAGYSGIFDLDLAVKTDALAEYRRGTTRFDELFFGTDKVRLRQQSPVYNAERIQVPVLLIHGKHDRRADFDQAQRMKSALQRANKPHDLLVLDQSKPEADTKERTAAFEKLLAFLERHLAAAPPAE
jgi:dienelactone hydrolase